MCLDLLYKTFEKLQTKHIGTTPTRHPTQTYSTNHTRLLANQHTICQLYHLLPNISIKMKSFAIPAMLLASAHSVMAQTQYYSLVASAPGAAVDAALLKPNDRFWHIGLESNSTCGDVAPAVTVVSSTIAIYNDGRSNQQFGKQLCSNAIRHLDKKCS